MLFWWYDASVGIAVRVGWRYDWKFLFYKMNV